MAAHREEQILAAVQTIVSGLATTGLNVDRGRAENIPEAKTPALRVHGGSDTIVDPWAPSLIDSELEVIIAAKVLDLATNVETTLSQIRKEVNIALMVDQQLGLPSIVLAIIEISASAPQITGDATKPAASRDFIYRVRYRRSRSDPSS